MSVPPVLLSSFTYVCSPCTRWNILIHVAKLEPTDFFFIASSRTPQSLVNPSNCPKVGQKVIREASSDALPECVGLPGDASEKETEQQQAFVVLSRLGLDEVWGIHDSTRVCFSAHASLISSRFYLFGTLQGWRPVQYFYVSHYTLRSFSHFFFEQSPS